MTSQWLINYVAGSGWPQSHGVPTKQHSRDAGTAHWAWYVTCQANNTWSIKWNYIFFNFVANK